MQTGKRPPFYLAHKIIMYLSVKCFHKKNMYTFPLIICWQSEAKIPYNVLQFQN